MYQQLMTSDEVAEYLRITPQTVRRLCVEGRIPGFKVGRQWRFQQPAVEKWAAEGGTEDGVDESSDPESTEEN